MKVQVINTTVPVNWITNSSRTSPVCKNSTTRYKAKRTDEPIIIVAMTRVTTCDIACDDGSVVSRLKGFRDDSTDIGAVLSPRSWKIGKEFRLHHERMASGIKIILTRDYLAITMTLR